MEYPLHIEKSPLGAAAAEAASREALCAPAAAAGVSATGICAPSSNTGLKLQLSDSYPRIALIDALAFSIVPPEGLTFHWLLEQMGHFLPIVDVEMGKGCFGFTHSARFGHGTGLVAWGGDSQKGKIYFSIQGQGCAYVQDWPELAQWLSAHDAVLKRVDLAHDDLTGEHVNIRWAVEQYDNGGFNTGGRKPIHSTPGDWLNGDKSEKGRTLEVGKRKNGKLCRTYEKGKQLGDSTSPWVRIEVEWRDKGREIPYSILHRPEHFLAGAYPCLDFLSKEQSRIKTQSKGGSITYEHSVKHGRSQCGKLINVMLQVSGGDAFAVVEQLRRDGHPARLAPYSYHILQDPNALDSEDPTS